MSKKPSSFALALTLAAAAALPTGALALNYTGSQKNEATFETLEEARTNGPVAVAKLEGNTGRTFKSHAVLDSYPKGTTYVYRSPNLYGGRAMPAQEFRKWKQKVLLGASLTVVAPTGQYDPTKLINWGINRWAFKPEFGYSQRWGNWILDGYAGVWFYTTNQAFFNLPVPQPQTEAPIGSLEGHLSYDIPKLKGFRRARLWCSLDGNFWWGGVTAVNSIRNLESKQTSSRIGATVSFPVTKFQSIKVAYSDGAYIRFGGNYNNVSVAWQYSWIGTNWK